MQDDYTFGWESEYETNVPALVSALHGAGLCGTEEMHRYHCDCGYCDCYGDYPLHAQTDSSCGGEIISSVMTDVDHARTVMDALQRLAIDVDAEPSLAAGLHVHVGVETANARMREKFLWAYLRWENVLGEVVAPGRWPGIRENNRKVTRSLAFDMDTWAVYGERDDPDEEPALPWRQGRHGEVTGDFDPLWVEGEFTSARARQRLRTMAYECVMDHDRHGWLNLSTRSHRTFEFRLWNATRVAWRIEMYVRTSLLFVNRDAMDDLLALVPNEENLRLVAAEHDPALALLIEKQLAAPKGHDPFTVMPGSNPATVRLDSGLNEAIAAARTRVVQARARDLLWTEPTDYSYVEEPALAY